MPLFLQLQSGAKAASHEGDADEDLLLLLQCCGGATLPGDGIHIFLNTASPGGKRCSERAEPLGPAGASAKNTTHSRLPSFQLHSVCRVFDRRLNYTLSFPHDQTPRPFL